MSHRNWWAVETRPALVLCAALTLLAAASADASQDGAFDEAAVSNRVYSILPALVSSIDGQRWAISELTDLVYLKGHAPYAFGVAERHVLDALRLSIVSPAENDQKLARDLLTLLGEIGSEQCVPFLVESLLTYSNDQAPKELPLLSTLVHVGRPAVEALLQRSVTEDDETVRGMFTELLVAHYGVNGALRWIDAVVAQNAWDDAQLKRLRLVRTAIGGTRQ